MILADRLKGATGGKEEAGDVTIFYNSVSGSNPEKVTGANGSFTFTVPMGYTEVTICMIGGGGSGAVANGPYYAGGGRNGDIVSQVVTGLVGGQQVTVTIGAGGARRGFNGDANGLSGGATTFNGISAGGGLGGLTNQTTYGGNGQSGSTCYGTSRNGYYATYTYSIYTIYGYGGERGFGNGGNGTASFNTVQYAGNGGTGAGGGAAITYSSATSYSGAGGSGACKITWS